MFEWITTNLIWTQGRTILIVALILTLGAWFVWKPLFIAGLLFLLWSFYFFRDPIRSCPLALSDDRVLVCPADGKVVDVQHSSENIFEGYPNKISIFLSAFDVHVNRTPMAGKVKKVAYKPGAFMLAFLPKSSELNERNDIIIENEKGDTILVRQIAGLVARRIVCWTTEGSYLKVGEKYGMIKFGSRVDIFLPACVTIEIQKGQYVYGGQTILGRWL